MPAWKKDKNIVYSSPAYILDSIKTKTPVVVVDVRNESKALKGHIDGAVNFSPDQLKQAKKSFPSDKSAPIIIYSDSDKESQAAFKTIRKWGYKNASILEGGITGWAKAGNSLKSGQLASEIVYIPKPVKGSIPVSEFKAIATSMPGDAVILDVRDASEVASGMIKGAINVPTQDVAARLSEIPKDKKIVIHCRTGIRASMAYQTLVEKGYNAYFLDAKITVTPEGTFKIES
ncbi:hypothetical protein KJ966_00090 [bacterium]|nr:hypothetical protein [bacterium]